MAIWTTCWEYLNQYYRSEIKIPFNHFFWQYFDRKGARKLANLRTCWSLVSLASPLFQAEPSQLCCLWRSQQSRLWKFQLLLGYGRQNIAGRIVGPGYSSSGYILGCSWGVPTDPLEEVMILGVSRGAQLTLLRKWCFLVLRGAEGGIRESIHFLWHTDKQKNTINNIAINITIFIHSVFFRVLWSKKTGFPKILFATKFSKKFKQTISVYTKKKSYPDLHSNAFTVFKCRLGFCLVCLCLETEYYWINDPSVLKS